MVQYCWTGTVVEMVGTVLEEEIDVDWDVEVVDEVVELVELVDELDDEEVEDDEELVEEEVCCVVEEVDDVDEVVADVLWDTAVVEETEVELRVTLFEVWGCDVAWNIADASEDISAEIRFSMSENKFIATCALALALDASALFASNATMSSASRALSMY